MWETVCDSLGIQKLEYSQDYLSNGSPEGV